jgi:hypothetical protein
MKPMLQLAEPAADLGVMRIQFLCGIALRQI